MLKPLNQIQKVGDLILLFGHENMTVKTYRLGQALAAYMTASQLNV